MLALSCKRLVVIDVGLSESYKQAYIIPQTIKMPI